MLCPHCEYESADIAYGPHNAHLAPKPGHYFLCLRCGGFSVFLTPYTVRRAYAEEVADLRTHPAIVRLQHFRANHYAEIAEN